MSILKRFKNLAFVLASMNICFSPLAVAAQAQSANVTLMKEFLKSSGLNKQGLTVGEYYRNIAKDMSPAEIAKVNPYFLLYQDEPMPAVDPIVFKDKNNIEQVRLAVTVAGKTYSLTTEGSGNNVKLKMNSYTFDKNPTLKPEATFDGLAKEMGLQSGKITSVRTVNDLKLAPTFKEWANFTKEQKIQFLIMTRYLMEDIQKVLPVQAKKIVQNESDKLDKFAVVFELLNPEACAGNSPYLKGKTASGKCIVAGYVTEYSKNGSCGGKPDGRLDLDAQQNQVKPGLSSTCKSSKSDPGISCNPLFYGYQDSGGPYCVAGSVNDATKQCGEKSVLRRDPANEVNDINRILSSYLKDKSGRGLKSATRNAKGEIEVGVETQADYDVVKQQLDALQSTYSKAMEICEAGADKTGSMDKNKITKEAPIMKAKADQASACNAIVKRYIAVQQLQLAPPAPPVKDIAKDTADREKCGVPTPAGSCACTNDGAAVGGGGAAVVVTAPPTDKSKGGGVVGKGSPGKCSGVDVAPYPERSIAAEEVPVAEKEEKSFCFDRNEDGSKHLNTTCGLLGLGAIALLGFGLYKWLDHRHDRSKNRNYDPVASPTDPVIGTTDPVVPIVTNPVIAPIPTAETPTTSTSVTTPTDTGTVRKATPAAGAR